MPPPSQPLDDGAQRPERIGRFVVEGVLGRGGMGVVYLARDPRLDRSVAIKALSDRWLDDPRVRARFEREAQLAAALNHPNVASIYGVEDSDGATYLVFERVEGETLHERLARGPMSVAEALDVCAQIVTGVAAAHRRGIVHRDLKPANVKISPEGLAKVLDFGIGKRVGAQDGAPPIDATETGMVLGTFGYMSPEQVRGEAVDERADVWALGCILFECLSHARAFPARTHADAIAAVLTGEPDWKRLPPETPARVRSLLKSALAKEARERPANAGEFAAALPGGFALEGALAAGETPTPQMVAAAGEEGSLAPRAALAWLGALIVALAAVVLFKSRTDVIARMPLEKSPPVLVERARTLIERLGVQRETYDWRAMWAWDENAWRWIQETLPAGEPDLALRTARPAPLVYWYRESPRSLAPLGLDPSDDRGDVTRSNPPLDVPGMLRVVLDPGGRLVELARVPLASESASEAEPAPVDWDACFAEAGLELARFRAVAPDFVSPVPCESRAAWEGAHPERAELGVRVEAASFGARPVFFEVQPAWPEAVAGGASGAGPQDPGLLAHVALRLLVIAVLAAVAWRHWRRGVADARGALRFALYVFGASLIAWTFEADHVVDAAAELHMGITELGYALFGAAFVWVVYVAVEPYMRRRWPWRMVSWNRLIAGRAGDPMVGRDVLVGAAGGALAQAITHGQFALQQLLEIPFPGYRAVAISLLNGEARFVVARAFGGQLEMLLKVFAFTGAYCLIHRAVRSDWLARVLIFALLFVVQGLPGETGLSWIDVLRLSLVFVIWIALTERVGLLAVVSGTWIFTLLAELPPIASTEDWWLRETLLYLALALAFGAVAAWLAVRPRWRPRTGAAATALP